MSNPKDRTAQILRKCASMLKTYHTLAVGGSWEEADRIKKLVEEVEKFLLYRKMGGVQ